MVPIHLKYSVKPDLYTPGTADMWTDTYIAKQLLPVHLQADVDLASRRTTTIESTLEWLLKQIPHRKKSLDILDLGCGPGLYTQRLAARGHRVTGVDFSENSISYAGEQADKAGLSIDYLCQNYLDPDLKQKLDLQDKRYDLIYMIYADFGVLLPNERESVLRNIRGILKPNGIFVFDVLNDRDFDLRKETNSWDCTKEGFWRDSPYLALSNNFIYPEDKVILEQHILLEEDKEAVVYRFWTQYLSHEKINSILTSNRFSVCSFHEDVLPSINMWDGAYITFTVSKRDS